MVLKTKTVTIHVSAAAVAGRSLILRRLDVVVAAAKATTRTKTGVKLASRAGVAAITSSVEVFPFAILGLRGVH